MTIEYKLNQDDIIGLVAQHYNVDKENVIVDIKAYSTGYVNNESEYYKVNITVKANMECF